MSSYSTSQPSSKSQVRAAILKELEKRKRNSERAELLKNDFGQFIRDAWSIVEPAMPLIDNWHIDALADHLKAIGDAQIRFLMINIGPGYAKSIVASVMFSAWLWARKPQTRILAATYASGLTIRDSIRTRDLIDSEWFRNTFNPAWKSWRMVKENEDWISNTKSGDRRALSVGGKATGFRADGQIFDDLLNASDKHSQPARDTAKDWAIRTMSTRFNDMRIGWRVVIGQRLHEDDPYGAMLATGKYEHLCLPSEFEPERRAVTSIGWTDPRTKAGELLFPELFTAEVIKQAKLDLGSYDYAGQHQQRPAPIEGELLKRDWWKYYDPAQMMVFDAMCISVDATFKAAASSDFVSIQVWGFIGPRSYLVDRIHERMGYVATKQAIKGLIEKYPRAWAKLIEDKANGSAIIEELKRDFYGVIAINPEGGKESRAAAVSPTIEAGNVYLPDLPWAQEVVEEAAVFPNGANDDDVDSLTQALMWRLKHNLKFGFTQYLKGKDEEMKQKHARKVKRTQELGNDIVNVPSMEQLPNGSGSYVDFRVACGNADALDQTLKAMVGGPSLVVDGSYRDGSCTVRCFGDAEFVKFAIDNQGYGKVDRVAGIAKLDVDDSTERCPSCSSTLIVRRGGGKRCNQCGLMFGMSGLGISDGQLRK